ncbi:MAG: histidine--tRNA ligase [Candidatus Heimdallarchaeota archaeon]|nr:histidine--tRNA ligase [Candidatus Heimdallarchaeota archaeon]
MTEEDKKIKIGKPAGFRDFFPEDFAKVTFILETMSRVSKEFGYIQYETPAVEFLKLYEIKSGEGLVKETFKVQGRSGQKMVLIPELTPSLTRMLAERQQYYTKPIRWFSLPKCYRDETLQRGRVKEFWQYNADILGMEEIYADAEIITILTKVISECGLSKEQFVVRINDRQFMQQFLDTLGVTNFLPVIQNFDRKDKILQERIQKELKGSFSEEEAKDISLKLRHAKNIDESVFKIIPQTKETEKIVEEFETIRKSTLINSLLKLGLAENQAEILFELSEIQDSPENFIQKVKKIYPGKNVDEALENLTELAKLLISFGISDYIEFDGSLARGLDYYTGIIFEAWSREGILPRAIAGGGRYADLVATLGGQPLTGTGFGFGETVLLELMEELNVKYPRSEICDVYIAPIKLENNLPVIELSNNLRIKGMKTILNLFDWKIKRHFENAEKMNAEWMIIVGNKDLENDSVTLRNIISGEQEIIPLKKIVNILFKKLKK